MTSKTFLCLLTGETCLHSTTRREPAGTADPSLFGQAHKFSMPMPSSFILKQCSCSATPGLPRMSCMDAHPMGGVALADEHRTVLHQVVAVRVELQGHGAARVG